MTTITGIPEKARVWLFTAERILSAAESQEINELAGAFCRQWTAHKVALEARANVLKNTFLVISVEEDVHNASGCSIDAMHQFVRSLESRFGIKLFDRMRVVYLEDEKVKNVTLREFENLFREGLVGAETNVFNALVNNGAELAQDFVLPLKKTWLAGRLMN